MKVHSLSDKEVIHSVWITVKFTAASRRLWLSGLTRYPSNLPTSTTFLPLLQNDLLTAVLPSAPAVLLRWSLLRSNDERGLVLFFFFREEFHKRARLFLEIKLRSCWSKWLCGLRNWSAVVRLLGLRSRIPMEALMSVCCLCCQVEISATGWSLVQRSPTERRVSEGDRESSTWGGCGPLGGCCSMRGGEDIA